MTEVSGRLQIELRRTASGVAAAIRSSRPVAASRVFVGKGVEETASLLPGLFRVCATAQAAACAQACEAALGLEAPPLVNGLRELLTSAETVREHLWRILLDWPRLLGEDPDGPSMAAAMAAFSRLRAALSGDGDPFQPGSSDPQPQITAALSALRALLAVTIERVLGASPQGWLERAADADGLRAWASAADTAAARLLRAVETRGWAALGRSTVPDLPRLFTGQLEGLFVGEGSAALAATPLWQGGPAESSPFTRNLGQPLVAGLRRRCHNGLLPRLAAQLAELATLLPGLRQGIEGLGSRATASASPASEALPAGVGLAQVQAARGLLVHRVAIGNGRVRDYRILAPTEWNFHPSGPVASGLAGLPPMDEDQLLGFAGLFVIAVDPCVDFAVTIT
jgi:hypothetical protein